MTVLATDLERRLGLSPYQGYLYAYPHKTAYRPFAEPRPLRDLWATERKDALFLYVHVPFCEFRCGFCNLFTQTNPREGLVGRFVERLERQFERVAAAVGPASFARFAIGGGTPTYLEPAALDRVFDLAEQFGARPREIPVSVETSPDTATAERLAVLKERGATRISIGLQSFVEDECRGAGRPQRTATAERALTRIKDAEFEVLNLDLIYGLPGQTLESWRASLERALSFEPEEIFLYPLYVRPLTGLGKRLGLAEPEVDPRLVLYRAGRELLLERGYEQVSMRLFRRTGAGDVEGPAYCCQEDGMIGLGVGARSYTSTVHYANEYAVGMRGVKEIIGHWVERSDAELDVADLGFELDATEQRRRYAIQSLLHGTGLSFSAYRQRFASEVLDDLPELRELAPRGLVTHTDEGLRLTADGLERSDLIGPWLISPRVRGRMEEYELR